MDDTSFDQLAVLLARRAGRRGALRAMLAAALGGGRAGAAAGQAAAGCFTTGKRCKHARQCCSGKCQKGACAPCGKGTKACGHACVDLRTDPKHCGACGTRCGAGFVCRHGGCFKRCPAPTAPCGTGCATCSCDASTDDPDRLDSLACVDRGVTVGTCLGDADCPLGAICDALLFAHGPGSPERLCTRPCPCPA